MKKKFVDFDRVIWREKIIGNLQHMVAHKELPHALMFHGRQGSGMLAHALRLAQFLLSHNSDLDIIDENSAEKVRRGIHSDLHFTFPISANKEKPTCDDYLRNWLDYISDKSYLDYVDWMEFVSEGNAKKGNIPKAEIARMLRKTQIHAVEGDAKVFIVWNAELLSKEGNRILKVLEEPPNNVYFILIANNLQKILPTILSRCQLVNFPPYTNKDIDGFISLYYPDMGPDRRSEVAMLSGSNMFTVEQLARGVVTDFSFSEHLIQLFREAFKIKDIKAQNGWVDVSSKMSREKTILFFKYCVHFIQEVVLKMSTTAYSLRLTASETKAADWLSSNLELEQLEALLNVFNKGVRYQQFNVNSKILFNNILHRTIRIVHRERFVEK